MGPFPVINRSDRFLLILKKRGISRSEAPDSSAASEDRSLALSRLSQHICRFQWHLSLLKIGESEIVSKLRLIETLKGD